MVETLEIWHRNKNKKQICTPPPKYTKPSGNSPAVLLSCKGRLASNEKQTMLPVSETLSASIIFAIKIFNQ